MNNRQMGLLGTEFLACGIANRLIRYVGLFVISERCLFHNKIVFSELIYLCEIWNSWQSVWGFVSSGILTLSSGMSEWVSESKFRTKLVLSSWRVKGSGWLLCKSNEMQILRYNYDNDWVYINSDVFRASLAHHQGGHSCITQSNPFCWFVL